MKKETEFRRILEFFVMLSLRIFSQLMLIGMFEGISDAIYKGSQQIRPKVGDFPYMVQIFDTTLAERTGSCGGAIIDPTHILTAAHCFAHSLTDRLTVCAGAVDLYSDILVLREGVAEIFIHEKYAVNGTLWNQSRSRTIQKWFHDTWKYFQGNVKDPLYQYDIAVLKLMEALPFGDNIKAVNLPSPNSSPDCFLCDFAGWGETKKNRGLSTHLYATQFIVLLPEVCESMYTFLPSNEFCAIHPSYETMPLPGDSGAPLVLDNVVYGVASRSPGYLRLPIKFTKVTAHLKWIRTVLKK